MKPEQGHRDLAGRSVARLDREPDQPELLLEREPVTRLYSDGGDSAGCQSRQRLPGEEKQRRIGGRARRFPGVANAAALLRDLQIQTPASRCACSTERSPAKIRCVCGSTRPG